MSGLDCSSLLDSDANGFYNSGFNNSHHFFLGDKTCAKKYKIFIPYSGSGHFNLVVISGLDCEI